MPFCWVLENDSVVWTECGKGITYKKCFKSNKESEESVCRRRKKNEERGNCHGDQGASGETEKGESTLSGS